MSSDTNKSLSGIFREMSAMYRYKGITERFRALAYAKAAKVIESLTEDISIYVKNRSLKDLPGIGEGIADKITEYLRTGHVKKYEQLKRTTPHELIEMMEIRGFGPQTLKKIHRKLKISRKEDLAKALQEGKVETLKGFGRKRVVAMQRGLKLHKAVEDRMLLSDALEVGEELVSWLKKIPQVKRAEYAGSLRRAKETIGDIDILVASDDKDRKTIMAHFISSDMAKQVLAQGNTKASIILKKSGRQADLRIVNPDEWGSAFQYFTGSQEHNIHLRSVAKSKGYKISEYGLYLIRNNKKIAGKTEEEIYTKLGFQPIPPEMREDRGEIELALKHKVPELVSPDDIKGDLQMHSTWSDGMNSVEEIAMYVKKHFPYEYIAITDHSKSSRIANGMDEKQILKQIKSIRDVNKKIGQNFVKSGIEVDIRTDGTLDISNDVLSQLDWVTASIHTGFAKDNTDRLIRACENPYVNCIGHPTGRLIGSRMPYVLDMQKIIDAARRTNTALEINAQPERMDLNDEQAMLAREHGVKLIISTDSHTLKNLFFMNLGVLVARRAWCTASDVLNTQSWKKIEQFFIKKKRTISSF